MPSRGSTVREPGSGTRRPAHNRLDPAQLAALAELGVDWAR
ncbi:hypothetical protein [Streptomyces sp. NPDC058622]